jgi:hypothetical protein
MCTKTCGHTLRIVFILVRVALIVFANKDSKYSEPYEKVNHFRKVLSLDAGLFKVGFDSSTREDSIRAYKCIGNVVVS